MNSLGQLNSYNASASLTFTDNRLPDVKFSIDSPVNQTQSVNEGSKFLATAATDILDIVNAVLANPVYRINVSAFPGTTISYASVPSGVNVNQVSTGVYEISGIDSVAKWAAIKQPTINLPSGIPNAPTGIFNYTSTILYVDSQGAESLEWTTTVTVNDVTALSAASSDYIFTSSATNNLAGGPSLVSGMPAGLTWTVTITPSQTSPISTFGHTGGSGGTFIVNSSTKVVTVSGSDTVVNSYLNSMTMTTTSTAMDFTLTYVATNNLGTFGDTKSQNLKSASILYLGSISSPTIYYAEDSQAFTVNSGPLITDNDYSGSGTYTYTITPPNATTVETMSTSGSGGTSTFNNTTKVLTITGTKTQVNSHIPTLSILMFADMASTFNLTYAVTTPNSNTQSKVQAFICSTNDLEISNMNISRNFTSKNPNLIFATNTPQIVDLDTTGLSYTATFSTAGGYFSYPVSFNPTVMSSPATSISITGTREYVNLRFADIIYYPTVEYSTSFTYTQQKDGVQQVSQSVTLNGTPGTYQGARTVEFASSQTWTPTIEDVLYGRFDLYLIGGGGGGAGSGGGGGGGEWYPPRNNLSFSNQTYTITIGAGGLGTNGTSIAGNDGANTVAFGYTARGGKGGEIYIPNQNPEDGSSGGTNGDTVHIGGQGYSSKYGGGGGGSYSAGNNATTSSAGVGGNGTYIVINNKGYAYLGSGGGGGNKTQYGGGAFGGGDSQTSSQSSWGIGASYTAAATLWPCQSNPSNVTQGRGAGGGGGGYGRKGGDGCPGLVVINIHA